MASDIVTHGSIIYVPKSTGGGGGGSGTIIDAQNVGDQGQGLFKAISGGNTLDFKNIAAADTTISIGLLATDNISIAVNPANLTGIPQSGITGLVSALAGKVDTSDSRLTDDRTASGLRTASTIVSISSATAPTIGQILVATSSTAATWQTPAAGSSSTYNETPTPAVDDTTVQFFTAIKFAANSTRVYLNGLRQVLGAGESYTEAVNGLSITFTFAPPSGSKLRIDYDAG